MPSTSAPPTPLFPTSGNSSMPLSFPSQLPLRSAKCLKSAGLENPYESLRTPVTPPSAYADFLRSSVVVKTPTSAKFEIPKSALDIPPTSAPLSANCTCHLTRVTINSKLPSRESSTSSTSSVFSSSGSISSLSSASSTSSEKQYYFAPPTPYTPGLRTPHSAHSGIKRLRIPPSPAFSSPGFGPKSAFCDSPLPIYATVPRTPIKEEDEDLSESEEESRDDRRRLPYSPLPIKSAGGNDSHSSGCRHHHLVRRVLVPRQSMVMAKAARMSLQPAPKGKKRRTE